MLKINNLHVETNNKEILKGFDLQIQPGQIHAIMGPNGTGKSTLANVLTGKDGYHITQGEIIYNDKDLLSLDISQRSLEGIFLAFQYPVEIPGVTIMTFLKAIVNSKRKFLNQEELNGAEFLKLVRKYAKTLNIDEQMLKRSVNHGFSGGEKKRFEALQMLLLDPKLIILDETDSGLDIDALKVVSNSVNSLRSKDRSFLVITHYQRLLDHIKPDVIHIMHNGKIITSGGFDIVEKLEQKGYEIFGINAENN